MISIEKFFAENGIFIIIPLVMGVIKIIHDLLPTAVFLGLGFLTLGKLRGKLQTKQCAIFK